MMERISCSPSEAQKKCNFVLFVSHSLPIDLVLRENFFRPESKIVTHSQENNRSSFRQVYEGDNRTLIVKQFYYDWAPAAYDHPCLWRDEEIASKGESSPPIGKFINNNVLWVGKNYRKQTAATIEIERTRIEITFAKGNFTDKEIVSMCKGFIPVDIKRGMEILNLSYSEQSYANRFEETASNVPTGYWKHTRNEGLIIYSLNQKEIPKAFLKAISSITRVLNDRNYFINGSFGVGISKSELVELDLVFEHQKTPGCSIRVLCTKDHSPFSIALPPEISDQECRVQTLKIHNILFFYATSKNFEFGSHEIIFKDDSFHYLMIVKPAPWTSFKWTIKLLASFCEKK